MGSGQEDLLAVSREANEMRKCREHSFYPLSASVLSVPPRSKHQPGWERFQDTDEDTLSGA